MKKLLCLFFLCCFFLTGCNERNVEEELLVIVLAIDQTENERFDVAIKVPANTSGSASSDKEASGYLMLQASGHSFSDAVSMLNATTPRRLNFSQVREIIIGETAANQSDFSVLLHQIDTLPRFRCSAAVIVCRGNALDFTEQQKPYVGMRLSRYAENTLASNAGKGFTPSTDLCVGVRDLGYGFSDPLFILGAVNDFSNKEISSEQKSLDDTAGSLPRKSIEPIEMFGAAATNGVSVSGYLTGYEMALLHLISGHVEALTLQQGDTGLQITARKPAALSVDLSKAPVVLGVALSCEILYPPGSSPDQSYIQNQLQTDIAALIRHLQFLGCDGVGFGDIAIKSFLTIQDWEAFEWREKYTQAALQIKVDLQCREK